MYEWDSKIFCIGALIIPLTSAECERIFSHVKLVYTKLRNRLKIDTVDTLIFISRIGPHFEKKVLFG